MSGVVAPVVFTTDTLPHRDRLPAWQARFAILNDVTPCGTGPGSVSVRTEDWVLGDMLLSVSRTAPALFVRSPQHLRRDGLDHWIVRMLLRGRSRTRHGGTTHVIEAGAPFLFRLDAPWETEWEDAAWISLCVPRDAHPGLAAACALRGAGPLRGEGAVVLAEYLRLLEHQIRAATPARVPVLAASTAGVLAACLAAEGGAAAAAPADLEAAQFERVRGLIQRHLHSPRFGPQRLASLAGMSRSALYRLFEGRGGVAEHIHAMRLRRAVALLSDPALANQPIAALAERAGFFDASAFSRAFRAAHGCSPREARQAALAGLGGARLAAPVATPADDYAALLRGIGQSSARAYARGS
ncbi:helix-turn-helix domain-containing protein [Roseomonas sp. AR75]|uniref:helix-turn-helix domain-containing protein n=1 Tax=Roseomonas sp. AR75 TaxID=2562311 RepID=UPI0010C10B16|nr:helix-turn-helix domain-containing protein [Roseomonas sp. AR75]